MPDALRAATRQSAAAPETLELGLNAIARAHRFNYFADGHRGGALVSAYFFCREQPVEPGVPALLAQRMTPWLEGPLCDPFPAEPADAALLETIRAALERNREGMRGAGHNVILPVLALKGFRERPDLLTPARVDGLCRLIDSFERKNALLAQPGDADTFRVETPAQAAQTILDAFVTGCGRWSGHGNGWTGHLLTYGRAMVDLHRLGHAAWLPALTPAFNIYLRKVLNGPQSADGAKPDHTPIAERPYQEQYWATRGREFELGHSIKYPYGYYGLVALAADPALRQAVEAVAYQIF